MSDEPKIPWFIPATVIRLADGSTLVKPGKAIQRAKVSEVVKMTGVHRKTLAALADCGLIRRAWPSPNSAHYYPGEVEELIRQTEENPKFWDEIRTKAYLSGTKLRAAKPTI